MLDPREVQTIERVVSLLRHNSKDPAPIKMLELLLKDTEDAINNSKPENIMKIIPKVINRLRKELGYGKSDNISTKSVQRDSNGTSGHGDEWNESQQAKRDELATK